MSQRGATNCRAARGRRQDAASLEGYCRLLQLYVLGHAFFTPSPPPPILSFQCVFKRILFSPPLLNFQCF